MIVREESNGDRAAVRAIIAAAFGRPDEADLVDRLRLDGDAVVSLVAVEDAVAVGHVMLSRMTAPVRAVALAPLAVLPHCQRRGIGSRLVRGALERGRLLGCEAVFVLGDPAFYRRFGFDAALAAGFQSPYAGPHLMAVALADGLPVAHGRIAHAPAFTAST
jgi:putative acetyltransferase